jgi:type IV pilus biogenesis protein CpaD/CtpE
MPASRTIVTLALAVVLAGCGSSDTTGTGPATTSAERMQHWRDVVAPMTCDELDALEDKRLHIKFNDQRESLTAIHDAQAAQHCPQ